MRTQLFLLLLISSLSLQAMDSDTESGLGNAGSVSATEIKEGRADSSASTPLIPHARTRKKKKEPQKKWSRKRIAATALVGALAFGSAQTPVFVGTAVSNMVEVGSPITAYPADFNCTGIKRGWDQQEQCPPVFPNISRNPNCTYEEYKSGSFPPGYVKGVCACGRPNGCACIIEECKGAEKFKSAYTTYLASLITGGVLEGIAVACSVSGLIYWWAIEN